MRGTTSATAGRRIVQLLLMIGLFAGAYLALSMFDHAARADEGNPAAIPKPSVGTGEIAAVPRAAKASTTGRRSIPVPAETPAVRKPVRIGNPAVRKPPVRIEKAAIRKAVPVRVAKPEIRTAAPLKIVKPRVALPVVETRAVRPRVVLREATTAVETLAVRSREALRETTAAVRHAAGRTAPAMVATLPVTASGVPAGGSDLAVLPARASVVVGAAQASPPAAPVGSPVVKPRAAPAGSPVVKPQATPGGSPAVKRPAAVDAAVEPRANEDGPGPASPPPSDGQCAAAGPSQSSGGASPMSAGPSSWWPGLSAATVPPSTNVHVTGRSVRYCGPPS
ncbi:hypothetical protein Ait01nite_010980 [Actinoplanes italicus]|uniref:Uncharacterized protein n=1 Tax=Actinoplanes italicus TaxID=113567 RepID=A0A2T0KH20_9ACTN|nr:hypothetical protein [Actinoplanes italicus]PRX22537.1 hypothetical protein CLV67_10464 [Actinoplanes italicus]GIE28053.1 hypothetical protein Ait01nite_010980 [Actinoplanes italicus]